MIDNNYHSFNNKILLYKGTYVGRQVSAKKWQIIIK